MCFLILYRLIAKVQKWQSVSLNLSTAHAHDYGKQLEDIPILKTWSQTLLDENVPTVVGIFLHASHSRYYFN